MIGQNWKDILAEVVIFITALVLMLTALTITLLFGIGIIMGTVPLQTFLWFIAAGWIFLVMWAIHRKGQ